MLNREYNLLAERLTERAPSTKFFAFANTVETLNFAKSNDGHGWLGLRFQKHPSTPPNNCIMHVQLLDKDAQWQQLLLGMLGVNLIHACFSYENHEKIIHSFMGQTTGFKKDLIKGDVLVMGETKQLDEARYIHGIIEKGFFTFYGGHDPEDYQHFVGDPPTDLSLHRNSPGYRLILNNVLFPAARKKDKKT